MDLYMIKPYKIYGLVVVLFALGMADAIAETTSDQPVIRVAGWDVYADPEHRNKTIGFESFEEQTGYKIEFTPLTNLDQIIHYAETDKDCDVLIISNEGIEIL